MQEIRRLFSGAITGRPPFFSAHIKKKRSFPPLNKSDLKNFAIGARLALLQRVSDRAALYGVDEEKAQARAIQPSAAFHKTDGSVMAAAEIAQRNALIARVYQIGFRPAMEEAAYTWFNRLIALKYMQEHSRLPIPVRPLPDAPGAQPRLLLEAQDVALPGVERERVLALLQTEAALRENRSAAAHLIHGSADGRFRIIYAAPHLTDAEIRGVGYDCMPYQEACRRYLPADRQPGFHQAPDGEPFYFIPNPALGLWMCRE